ncbi:MAG: hypothetical protein GEV11_20425 [Streptosporangiales bacterium]|nr:hypothetical protein [Streptosporangiales bacterium]
MGASGRRKEIYREAFGILGEDLPGVGLFQTHAIYGTSGRVTWRPDAQESFFLADMEMRS